MQEKEKCPRCWQETLENTNETYSDTDANECVKWHCASCDYSEGRVL